MTIDEATRLVSFLGANVDLLDDEGLEVLERHGQAIVSGGQVTSEGHLAALEAWADEHAFEVLLSQTD